jgi:hypothetical protein
MLTRRSLLTSAGLLAGAPLLSTTALAIEPGLPRPQLSPAVLASTSRIVGQTTAKIHLRMAVRSDLEHAADAIELLRQHLGETAFDVELRALAQKANIAQFDNAGIQRQIFNEVWKYDHGISMDEIQIPVDLSAGVLELRAYGLDRGLKLIAQGMRGAAVRLPVVYRSGFDYQRQFLTAVFNDDYTAYFKQVQDGGASLCDKAGFWLNLLGGSLGVVALFGCAPEPAVFMICPAIGALSAIAGLVGFAQWIWC